jgi:hypothetical protein
LRVLNPVFAGSAGFSFTGFTGLLLWLASLRSSVAAFAALFFLLWGTSSESESSLPDLAVLGLKKPDGELGDDARGFLGIFWEVAVLS